MIKTLALFAITAVAEIVGCYLPYLWLKQGKSIWLLIPAGASLALFAWLLSLHPAAAGRVYAAYGGIYIGVAIIWLWVVDGIVIDQQTEQHLRVIGGAAASAKNPGEPSPAPCCAPVG
ncbi:YnfA family protein [Pseudomonas kielensis]|uniref:YnfA family protein n=1 Tax=Pseudomonas kielensis TaxID=2762577 RepID=A0A7X1GJF5_9PSED|nr:YnfA family protein [Pseudomonas kielensis]